MSVPPPSIPSWRLRFGEALAARELPRLLLRRPSLLRMARGNGRCVLVLPGFGAGDTSTFFLRAYLDRLGYRVRGWGLGNNRGDVPALIPVVTELVQRTAEESGEPVALVGWSLGGVLAREAAREAPEAVRRIVTLGSPLVGGPKYSVVGGLYAALGWNLDEIEATVAERNRVRIAAPTTCIYSRRDGIVAWQTCLDPQDPDGDNVEVSSTHIGLGIDPDVFEIVAERLARD